MPVHIEQAKGLKLGDAGHIDPARSDQLKLVVNHDATAASPRDLRLDKPQQPAA
jgi:hypothetical protein